MAKKVVAVIKLALQAGKANPAPPVGPALGQHGVNIMAFCKEYNARTQEKAGFVIPVEISVFEDRSFSFITKTPPASRLILKAAKIPKGSGEPNKNKVGYVSQKDLENISPFPFASLASPSINIGTSEPKELPISFKISLVKLSFQSLFNTKRTVAAFELPPPRPDPICIFFFIFIETSFFILKLLFNK